MKYITHNCTAVVATADNGGSSGRLRQELGIIPPGDLRNCLVALADTEPLMEKVMQYRFHGETPLAGHNLGNLFIAALADAEGSMESGLMAASEILKVRGKVVPSTLEDVTLAAEMSDGTIVKGESEITLAEKRIKRLATSGECRCHAGSHYRHNEGGCFDFGAGQSLYERDRQRACSGNQEGYSCFKSC